MGRLPREENISLVRVDVGTTLLVTFIFVASFVIFAKVRVWWIFAAVVTVIEVMQLAYTLSLETPPAGITILTAMTIFLWFGKMVREADKVLERRTK